ncbi:MAG: hypothetical protein II909_02830 [Kiritimatiellae bacterium]|nr:hypothetical protein [Kiritimatiellia bacterium]
MSLDNTGKKAAAGKSVLLYGLLAAIVVVCALAVFVCRSRISQGSGEGQALVKVQDATSAVESSEENQEEDEASAARRRRLRRKMRMQKRMERQAPPTPTVSN